MQAGVYTGTTACCHHCLCAVGLDERTGRCLHSYYSLLPPLSLCCRIRLAYRQVFTQVLQLVATIVVVLQRTKEEVWLQRMRNLLTSPLEQQ